MADITKRTQNWLSSPAAQTVSNNGITVDCDGKGTYHIHGTTTANAQFTFDVTPFTMTVNANIAFYNTVDTQRVTFGFMDGETSIAGFYLSPMNRVINNTYSLKNKEVNTVNILVQHMQNGYTVDMYVSPLIYVYSLATPDTFVPYWQHSLRKLTTATADIEPTIYSDGTAITSYTLKGNTVQDGTPTPSNPITISGVGNKTANLFNKNATDTTKGYVLNSYINGNGIDISSEYYSISEYIDITGITNITISGMKTSSSGNSISAAFYNDSKTLISADSYGEGTERTYSVPANTKYVRLSYRTNMIDTVMLNSGTTALPYDGYGYKIPISNGQGSAVNYLGSVQTTRKIQKLVFDGSENWAIASSGDTQYYQYTIGVLNTAITGEVLCTHYEPANISSSTTVVGIRVYNSTSINISALNVRPENVTSDMNTVTKFKNWLTEQYNNGTPVTVWYVLTTPTTDIVNEPLMKIGDYADTLSNATPIPTTDGANSITVDTTIQPSEFTATWTGWHNAYVKEKSENLFDGTVRNAIINDSTGEETSNNNWRCSDFIKVADTKVTLSWVSDNQYYQAKLGYYEAADTETFLSTEVIQGNRYSGTFTIPENCNYIKISYSVVVSGNPVTREDIMLNEGTTAQTYEPYWK